MAKGTLVLDRGGEKVMTLAQLKKLPAPVSQGNLHTPIPHWELVDGIKRQFQDAGFDTVGEQFAVTRRDQRLFGVLDLNPSGSSLLKDVKEAGMAVGIRQSNDRSMSVQIVAGMKIFVCSNLAFNGDVLALRRRHTSGVDLGRELEAAVHKVLGHYDQLNHTFDIFRNTEINDTEAKALIYDTFMVGQVMAPKYIPFVGDRYFHEEFLAKEPDCRPRTMMGLHNAFTRVIKDLPMARVQDTTINLTRFFSDQGMRNLFGPN